MTQTIIEIPESAHDVERNTFLHAVADAPEIHTQEEFAAAAKLYQQGKDLLGQIAEVFDPVVKAAHRAHKAATTARNSFTDPVENAMGIVKKRMNGYAQRQAEIEAAARREAERIAREAAEAQAMREAEAREAEARIAREARAKAEAEQRAAQEAAAAAQAANNAAAQEAARLAEAKARAEAEAQAMREAEAQDAADAAITNVVVPVVKPAQLPPKTKGVATRTVWDFEIVDVDALPRTFLVPDMAAIKAMVQAKKEGCSIPGVRVFSRAETTIRG